MRLVWSVALACALSLCFASEANSRPVAMTPSTGGQHIIVLTDEFHDACPVSSNAAVVYSIADEKFETDVLGCWVYDKNNDKIHIFWMSAETEETYTSEHDADVFIKLQNDPV